MQRIPVILDTDPGVDDAMALFLLLRNPAIDLRAITTVYGNASVSTTTRNACRLRREFAATTPVAQGASRPLQSKGEVAYPTSIHGLDGLGGDNIPASSEELLDVRPAHELICDMVNAEPGKITLLAIGPLTNLALALRRDSTIASKVARVVVMGGAFATQGHGGNVTPVAEANIFNDPEAADAVFTAKWPVVVVGLDVTQQVVMTEEYLANLRSRGAGAGEFVWQVTRGYQGHYQARDGIAGIYSHDASAAAYIIDPEAFQVRSGALRAVTEGIARGQTIQAVGKCEDGDWAGYPIQKVCIAVNSARILELFDQAFDVA